MTLAETLFLVLVVAAFSGYGLLLFTAWLFVEVLDQKKPPVAEAAASAPIEAERPLAA